jgi:hypothetical protein
VLADLNVRGHLLFQADSFVLSTGYVQANTRIMGEGTCKSHLKVLLHLLDVDRVHPSTEGYQITPGRHHQVLKVHTFSFSIFALGVVRYAESTLSASVSIA